MTNTKQFYIAYFNILGCRCFFNQNPDKAKDLLEDIHAAFDAIMDIVGCVQRACLEASTNMPQSAFANKENLPPKDFPKLKAYRKVFSDHILMCFEKTGDAFFDINNLLAMASITADIQREFILKYGISLRGCISQGKFSIDEDFAFGRDLIEATSIDTFTRMPRIIFAPNILHEIAINRTSLAEHELGGFYDRWIDELLFLDQDGRTILNYLYDIDSTILERMPFFSQIATTAKSRTHKTNVLETQSYEFVETIKEHAMVIEGKLEEYGRYDRFSAEQTSLVQRRYAVFQKYLWVAQFHNEVCKAKGLGGTCLVDASTQTDERFGLPCKKNAWGYEDCTLRA